MKYVYWTALLVIVSCSALFGYSFFRGGQPEPDSALVVNDRAVSREEFDRKFATSSYSPKDIRGFVDHLTTQELMIQEAQRLQIDREEAFRLSLQNFYEQSLIKTLMERKYRSLEVSAGEGERERYLSLEGRTVRLTILPGQKTPSQGQAESSAVRFEELSGALRLQIAGLKVGEVSRPFRFGDEEIAVRLDSVSDGPPPAATRDQLSAVERILLEDKREQAINEWLWGLKERASVEIRVPADR